MPALALTDHGTMYGAIEFYQAAKKAGIKPILGVEAYIVSDHKERVAGNRYHITLLVKNNKGWENILQLVTKSHLEGFYYKPRIDKELLKEHSEGLIGLSGCMSGEIPKALSADDEKRAEEILNEYKNIFEDFFIEVFHHPNDPGSTEVVEKLIPLAKKTNTDIVATQDIHYALASDAPFQDILLAVQTGSNLDDEDRLTMSKDNFSMRSHEEMQRCFKDNPEALENTLKVADLVDLDIKLGEIQLPHYSLPKEETNDSYLKKLTVEAIPKNYKTDEDCAEAMDRLDFELEVIKKTGFASYFLIVQDIVGWSKAQGIVVGPGRGSAAGSIISYLLGITSADPIKYNLLFERFMNPDRISMPDIDLDFADARRDEVIEYISNKYGRDHVAQIITFGTMAARAAIRDSGRALGMSYGFCDEIAKMVPFGPGWNLKKAYEAVAELQTRKDSDPEAARLLEAAEHLEGVVRHASTHACGLVVSKAPLTDMLPLQYATTGSGEGKALVTQFDMHAVEDLGLLKMDILGLSNLSIIEETVGRIKRKHDVDVDISNIPLDDKKTFTALAKGKTVGVFQLEGSGMTRYLKELKPTEFEDIVTMIALYRPGSLEHIPSFIRRKQKKEAVSYPHPLLEPYLKSTHGIMIYQEQLMQMSRAIAGFTPGEADTLRKAVGKKIHKLLNEQKEKFIEGVVKKTGSAALAGRLWELVIPFGDYGFNRSHAVCYAIIAYQTAWLKANYPVEFMASLLNSDAKNIDRMSFLISAAKKEGMTVLPPDINESIASFSVIDKKHIRFGLAAIKNVGTNVVSSIIEERLSGGFTSLTEFLERNSTRDLNKKSLESLIKTGALDEFGDRMQLLENMDTLLSYMRDMGKAKAGNQESLFGLVEDQSSLPKLKLADIAPATNTERLKWEKELLGLYVSGHPLEEFPEIKELSTDIHKAKTNGRGKIIRIAAMFSEVKRIMTKNGEPMAFVKLEDQNDNIEGVVFPRALQQYGANTETDKCVVIEGKVNMRNGTPNLICDKIEAL